MSTSKKVEVNKVSDIERLKIVHAIRYKVFVDGQNCPAELEYANEDESVHFWLLLMAYLRCHAAGVKRTVAISWSVSRC